MQFCNKNLGKLFNVGFIFFIICSFRSRDDSERPALCALWPVDLKLTHSDCSPGNVLVHFQGQYATICELDYNILQVEIQDAPKIPVSLEVGDSCLVEDFLSSRWYRGRVQTKSIDLFDVFLLDHGNILTVRPNHLSAISDSLLMLPPKIVCGFIANVLPLKECWDQQSEAYFSSLIGRQIKGYIHGLLPHKVLILEVPEITKDLLRLSLGRHVDTDTFLLLVELMIEVPIQQSYESVPDLLVEKPIAQDIFFKSPNLCGYDNIILLSGNKLVIGQKERIKIAAAVNPGLFYCQLSSAAMDLKEMSERLALLCESRKGDFREKPGDNMGLLCAIKGKDEKWHRGLVQCLPVNSQVRVVLIDCGYCESVKVENIFQLPSEFHLIPILTFPCSLSCLGDNDKAIVNQQLALLSKGLLGKELVMAIDDLSKEKNVCLVTLSNIVDCAPFKTVQSKEVDQTANDDIFTGVQRLSYISNETKRMGISKNWVALELAQDGSMFEGYVEYVQSPHDFWVRTAKSSDRFEAMMDKLTDWFRRLELNEEILQDPLPGQLCCAMYEKDMHYYRATVVDILEYGAEVRFIDFGNKEKVPSMLIKKIPTEFTVEPEFALNCSLAYVAPLDDVWTTTATDFFRTATSNKALLVHALYRRNDVCVVELYQEGHGKGESIATLLTSAKMADYWPYSVIKAPDIPVETKNQTGKTFAREQLAKRSCKTMSQKLSSKVIREETGRQVHTEIEKCSSVTMFREQKFLPGAEISVMCAHVNSPSDFWCQNKKNKKDLERLMERLQLFYQTNTSVLQPHSVCCAVRFQLDNKWYRGCILGGSTENVMVNLVDYGMVVQEKLQNLQVLHPEFLELEGQAFRCSLYNVTDLVGGDVWSDEACTLLKDFATKNSCNLKCKIHFNIFVANKGLCNVVDLFTPLQGASTHLIEKGVAKEIQCSNQLQPSVYPCSFVYSSFDITIGSEELVFPTHVVSPWEIYLQLDRNTELIEQLMDRAMEETEKSARLTHTGETAMVCLAKYSVDGKWYRSIVWRAQSSQYYNVFFVDFGGMQVSEKKNVLPIPLKAIDLLLTPMQALRCSLLDIPAEEHLPEVNTWLEKTILNKGLRAKFAAANNSGHFICDLFDGDIHINEKVRELFAIHGQKAKSLVKPISDGCKEVVSSVGNKLKIKQRNHVESMFKSQKTPGYSEIIMGIEQSGQKKISKLKSQQKLGSLKKTCQGKVQCSLKPSTQLQKEKWTIPCTSNIQSSKVLPKVSALPAIKIAPGFKSVGFISHYNSVDSFFIQMQKDELIILKMRKELNSRPIFKHFANVNSKLKVGDLVAARYNEALYRAAVNSVASCDYLTVEFVDYGNTATVHKKSIYPLASKFLSEARLSTHCKLSKPYSLGNVDPFFSFTRNKTLMVEFVQNLGYVWEVSIQGLDLFCESRGSDTAEGKKGKVPDSGQAEQRQKVSATVHENDSSMRNVCEQIKAKTTSIKKETKRFKSGTIDGKVVQEKTLEQVQATRASSCTTKLTTVRKAHVALKPEIQISVVENELLNLSNNSSGWSVELPEIAGADRKDISLKNGQSSLHQPNSQHKCPAPVAITTEKPLDKESGIQRLFLAPVKSHEYSGFAAAVTTPGEFYVVLEDQILIMNTVSNVLKDIAEDLQPLLGTHLIPGSGCLVKSDDKKKWCRAEIVQCDDTSVIIFLVDYGYFVHLASQDACKLKVLPVELARLPKITYPCLLRGITPADELQWSDCAAMFFQQCVYKKNLKIHFREYVSEAQWKVDVVASNRNVAKELVDAGHAHYIDNVLEIRLQQEVGLKNFVENVSEDVSHKCEQTQSKMEKVLHRYLEDVASNDDDQISQSCCMEGATEDPLSGTPDNPGSA